MEEINIMLRPKTGFQYFEMSCKFFDTGFILTHKKEALFDWNEGKQYTIHYKDIEYIEEHNYMWVSGVRIYLKNENIDYPISPSKAFGGLLGGLVSYTNKDKFIFYFNEKKDKNKFYEIINKKLK